MNFNVNKFLRMCNLLERFSLSGFILVLAAALLMACSANEGTVELQVEMPTPTNTPTPFPTRTLLPTSTPPPPPTPAATATPRPAVVAQITGPKVIPPGLPRAVEWHIEVIRGAELVIVSVDDLGGTMLTGDTTGQLTLARTLLPAEIDTGGADFESEWVIRGVLDPNVGQGQIGFYFETASKGETVNLSWTTGDVQEIETHFVEIRVDGETDPGVSASRITTGIASNEYQSYVSPKGTTFEYPATWFVQETQDGIIQLSIQPLAALDGARPASAAYATLLAGSWEAVGLPEPLDASASEILDWLLGDLTTTGGSSGGTFLSDELELISRKSLELPGGESAEFVELQPLSEAENDPPSFRVIYFVLSRSESEIYIITAFEPAGQEMSNQLIDLLSTLSLNS